MPTDIVFPKGNEREFLEMAEKLGYSTLIFCYSDFDTIRSALAVHHASINIKYALLIRSDNKHTVAEMIKKAKREHILTVVRAGNDTFNRFVLEKTDADYVVDLEYVHQKDHLHFRRSGLDQVLCQLAARRKITFLTSFSRLLESKDRALFLGRIIQNIGFCKKYGVDYSFISFARHPFEMKGAHDLQALMATLGCL